MRREPEAIRAQVSAIAAELRGRQSQLLELIEELESQTPEIPEAVLEQSEPPPLFFHFALILQAAEQELGASVEFLSRLVELDEAEMVARWTAQRRRDLCALAEATMRQVSLAQVHAGQLAMCAHNGLSDKEIPGAVAALSAIKKAAQQAIALDAYPAREEEEEEEGKNEGEEPR